MERKIYVGGGLGSQILVIGGKGEVITDELVDMERVELPELPSAVEMKITSPVTFTPWYNENANRKERRRLYPKAKVRFR